MCGDLKISWPSGHWSCLKRLSPDICLIFVVCWHGFWERSRSSMWVHWVILREWRELLTNWWCQHVSGTNPRAPGATARSWPIVYLLQKPLHPIEHKALKRDNDWEYDELGNNCIMGLVSEGRGLFPPQSSSIIAPPSSRGEWHNYKKCWQKSHFFCSSLKLIRQGDLA